VQTPSAQIVHRHPGASLDSVTTYVAAEESAFAFYCSSGNGSTCGSSSGSVLFVCLCVVCVCIHVWCAVLCCVV